MGSLSVTRSESLAKSWKKREDYKGYDRTKGSSYNSWRSIRYTNKGKEIGSPSEWKDYNVFIEDVQGIWERGKIVTRLDTSKPHSKNNSLWSEKGTENIGKLATLEHEGITKTLIEWCEDFDLNYNGARQRYFKGKNFTSKQILFGKKKRTPPKADLDFNRRTSKMLSQYRLSDKKRNMECDITLEEFRKDYATKNCVYCYTDKRIGLDRLNNSKGHTKDNVAPCCYECNVARSNNFSYDEMLIIGKAIKEVRSNRENN